MGDEAPEKPLPTANGLLRHLIGAANAIRAEIGAEIVALGHEYSPAASHLVVNLPPEGLGMSELADRLRLTPQRTGQLVQNLESFGYVERVPAPEDGRARRVVFTDRGRELLADIDRICDHVGVMHEGRMIFNGPMRDMKLRLRRDDFSLDLEGSGQEIGRLAQQAGDLEGVDVRVEADQTLLVRISDVHSRARALAEVLKMVDAANLLLQDLRCGQNETENAYLQLLQEDEAHGFQRFDFDAGHADDAIPGDPPA